jgi:hypothetical protein
VNTILYAALSIIIGYQAVVFAIFTKVFAINEGLLPEDARLTKIFRHFNLEVGLISGGSLLLAGITSTLYVLNSWEAKSFGMLDASLSLRIVIPAVTMTAIGFQTILSSFFLSVLGMKRK